MQLLALGEGEGFAMVDDVDYERLAKCRWKLDSKGIYPIRADESRRDGKRIVVYLAHMVLPKAANPRVVQVDHIDGDPRNAQRANLRYATRSQNQANRHRFVSRTGYKGVTLHRQTGKYQAQIRRDGKDYYLGIHTTPEAAARAYAKKGAELFGEYHWHNAPPEPEAEPDQEVA